MDHPFDDQTLAALNAPLDPSRVSSMTEGPQAGIPFLDGHDVISTANRIFGFGNWGFELLALPTAHAGTGKAYEGKPGKPFTVWMAHGKLTVRGGLVFSDMGTNLQSGDGGPATEMASKGAVTDAIKRCLKQYGDQFGLVLYDKDVGRRDLEDDYEKAHQPERAPARDTKADEQQRKANNTRPVGFSDATGTGAQDAQRMEPDPVWAAFIAQCKLMGIGAKYICSILGYTATTPLEATLWLSTDGPGAFDMWCFENPAGNWSTLVSRAADLMTATREAAAASR